MIKGLRNAALGKAADIGGACAQEEVALSAASVARMFKVSPLTLRLYELRGLIRRECAGGQWLYSWSDCERIALIVKAQKAGVRMRDLKPVIVAMNAQASLSVADAGRLKALWLIQLLEDRQQAVGSVLGELYRIEWELAARLGVKDSGGNDATADRD